MTNLGATGFAKPVVIIYVKTADGYCFTRIPSAAFTDYFCLNYLRQGAIALGSQQQQQQQQKALFAAAAAAG